jgi:hypothetical protein
VGQAFADGLDSGCERRIDARLPMGRESHVLERHVLDQPVGAEGRKAVLGIVPVESHTAKQLAGEVLIQARRLWRFAVTHEWIEASCIEILSRKDMDARPVRNNAVLRLDKLAILWRALGEPPTNRSQESSCSVRVFRTSLVLLAALRSAW